MKKILSTLLCLLVLVSGMSVFAAENSDIDSLIEQILVQTPISESELISEISNAAIILEVEELEIAQMILAELEADAAQNENNDSRIMAAATQQLPTKETGGVFYEPASTVWIQHGHVGIYYTASTIIESVPGDGVRQMSCSNKYIEGGSMYASVNQTSYNRSVAANWAYNCLGDAYSYNFATNRLTAAYGDKNCSKLVWSSYMETCGIDLDANGGLGVYPNDIKDSSYLISRVYTF